MVEVERGGHRGLGGHREHVAPARWGARRAQVCERGASALLALANWRHRSLFARRSPRLERRSGDQRRDAGDVEPWTAGALLEER
eukprot:6401551-Prymnesium_polylepis.2